MTTRSRPIPGTYLALVLVAFLGLCALPGLPAACADVFVWAGGTGPDGDSWCSQANWLLGEGYPGQHDTADVVLVGDMHTQHPVVSCRPPFPIGELHVLHGGGLTIAEALSVRGDVSVMRGASLQIGTAEGAGLSVGEGAGAAESCERPSCALIIRAGSIFLLEGELSLPCKLVVEPEGELRIGDGGLLEQTEDATNEIGGLVRLTSGTSTYRVRADVILGPYVGMTSHEAVHGLIIGEHAAAQIQIGRGRVLTNRVSVRGAMAILAWSEP